MSSDTFDEYIFEFDEISEICNSICASIDDISEISGTRANCVSSSVMKYSSLVTIHLPPDWRKIKAIYYEHPKGISIADFHEMLAMLGCSKKVANPQRFFDNLDDGKTGYLDFTAFITMVQACSLMYLFDSDSFSISEIFRTVDTDQGGSIDLEEWKAFNLNINKAMGERVLLSRDMFEMFEKMDEDGGGSLDITEWVIGFFQFELHKCLDSGISVGLNRQEFHILLKDTEFDTYQINSFFNLIDLDNRGFLTATELVNYENNHNASRWSSCFNWRTLLFVHLIVNIIMKMSWVFIRDLHHPKGWEDHYKMWTEINMSWVYALSAAVWYHVLFGKRTEVDTILEALTPVLKTSRDSLIKQTDRHESDGKSI